MPVRTTGNVAAAGGYPVGVTPRATWFQRAVQGSPTWGARARGAAVAQVSVGAMRDAGAVAGYLEAANDAQDVGDALYTARAPEVEAGIQASIWRGVARELASGPAVDPQHRDAAAFYRAEAAKRRAEELGASGWKSAGDPVPGAERSGDAATFDPRDPASMTAARWSSMSAEERRAWIDASVRSETERTAMYREAITGGFDTVRRFVDAEKERRLAEIRETAQTERERIRADADVERARIDAEVRRAQVEAERLRAEAERLRAEAGQGGASGADATARAAAEERARAAEAEAARLRALQAQGGARDDGARWSYGQKVGAAVGGAVGLGLLGWAVHEWMEQRKRERLARGLPA